MNSYLLIAICFLIGATLRATGKVRQDAPIILGTLVIYLPLPALILLNIHDLKIDATLWPLIMAHWAIFLLGIFIIERIGKRYSWSSETIACLQLTCGLGNTSFLGFPVTMALYGPAAIQYAAVIDEFGSFLALATVGTLIVCRASRPRKNLLP